LRFLTTAKWSSVWSPRSSMHLIPHDSGQSEPAETLFLLSCFCDENHIRTPLLRPHSLNQVQALGLYVSAILKRKISRAKCATVQTVPTTQISCSLIATLINVVRCLGNAGISIVLDADHHPACGNTPTTA
jgi:hypothetical protein